MIAALLLTIAFLAQQSPAAGQAEAAVNAELLKLERVWNEAHLSGDAQALDNLWADDLVVTVPRMRVFTKADGLAIVKSGHMRFERYETSNVHVQAYRDSAIATGRLRRTRTVGEKSVEDDWQFTKVYVRREGQWKVAAFHASEAPQ